MPYSPRATLDNPYGPMVAFRTEDVLPPTAFYVAMDDQIYFRITTDMNGYGAALTVRWLDPLGVVKVEVYNNAPNVVGPTTNTIVLPQFEGYLLGMTVTSSPAQSGRVYCRVDLIRGAVPNPFTAGSTLMLGYATDYNVLSWPYGAFNQPLNGPGGFLSITRSLIAGQQFSFTVPFNVRWRVSSLFAGFSTSAAAGNRLPYVQVLDDSSLLVGLYSPMTQQAGSQFTNYTWGPGLINQVSGAAGTAALPTPLLLPQQFTLASGVVGMDAGDRWQNIALSVEEWIGD